VIESVSDPAAGGTDVFIGTTRDRSNEKEVVSLVYEAYTPMALKVMRHIADEVIAKWHIRKISIVHRVGRVEIGEASIVIAVSADHRQEAFAACRHAIDALKQSVPIWKKEQYRSGDVWVGLEGNTLRPIQ